MKKRLDNEHGYTLTELLATLVISSFIILVIVSAFLFILKQFTIQTTQIQNNTNITTAIKSISNKARQADTFIVSDDKKTLQLIDSDGFEIASYSLEENILKKDHANYIYDIKHFTVSLEDKSKLHIRIVDISGNEIETEIVKRGGIDDEE